MARVPRGEAEINIKPKVDMSDIERRIASYKADIDTCTEKMRTTAREAHEAVQELRETMKRYEDTKKAFLSEEELNIRLIALANDAQNHFVEETKKAIDIGTEACYRRFDAIAAILMGEDPQSVKEGRPSVVELLRHYIRTKGMPYKLVPTDNAELPEAFRSDKPKLRILAEDETIGNGLLIEKDRYGDLRVSAIEAKFDIPLLDFEAMREQPHDRLDSGPETG